MMTLPVVAMLLGASGVKPSSWSQVVDAAAACAKEDGGRCRELFGDSVPAELDDTVPAAEFAQVNAPGCAAGDKKKCCALADDVWTSARTLAFQNVGLEHLIDACFEPGIAESVMQLATSARRDATETADALRVRAALLERAARKSHESCFPPGRVNAKTPAWSKECLGASELAGLSRLSLLAADALEKTGSVCDAPFGCAVECLGGIVLGCEAMKPKKNTGGGFGDWAVAMTAAGDMMYCAAGLDGSCGAAELLGRAEGPPSVLLARSACEAEGGTCAALATLPDQRAWLDAACDSGRSGQACVARKKDEPKSRDPQGIWAREIAERPYSWEAQRAVVLWAKGVKPGASKSDDPKVYEALWTLAVSCAAGVGDENLPCSEMFALLEQPASALKRYRARLEKDCAATRIECTGVVAP